MGVIGLKIFLGTEERVKSGERNGGISSSGLIEVTVEIHARLTIDLVSFSVRGVAASLCPRTGSSTVPYSANRREFRVRIRASIGLSGRRIGGRRESLPLCASLRSLPFPSVRSPVCLPPFGVGVGAVCRFVDFDGSRRKAGSTCVGRPLLA